MKKNVGPFLVAGAVVVVGASIFCFSLPGRLFGGASAAIPIVGLAIQSAGLFAGCIIARREYIADVKPRPKLGLWGIAIGILGFALGLGNFVWSVQRDAIAARDRTVINELTTRENLPILGICIAGAGFIMWGLEYRRILLMREESKSAGAD